MSSYPTDRKSCGYSIRYIRWLLDSGRVNQIGPDSFTLLVAIVTMEDQLHYERAPDFWREQLLSRCGMKSVHSLISARQRAVDAGLLYHKPGTKSIPGVYFTTGFHAESAQKVNGKRTESEQNTATSIPIPIPNKETASLSVSPSKAKTTKPQWKMPEGVNADHWRDWLLHRKAKRASNTPSAWTRIEREAAKARMTIPSVVQTCAERSWVGFESSWVASSVPLSSSEYKPFVPSTSEDPIKPKRRSV